MAFDAARPWKLVKSWLPITINPAFEAIVQVRFGKGTPVENEPAVATLRKTVEVVRDALNQIENLANV